MPNLNSPFEPRKVGRYLLHREIAHGGMATVHVGRLLGQVGFSRTVAIKKMHEHCAKDPDFVSMFIDEARLAARIRHPNVVPTLDVVAIDGELLLIMEYVQGETLARLIRQSVSKMQRIDTRVVAAVIAGVLEGLHAAHDAVGEQGEPLGIVHRDVSPQNIMVGNDGVPRVLDFGVAKAANRLQTTRDGQIKGKVEYMAPEQIRDSLVDRRTDVYAVSCCLWEMLTGQRLFTADNPMALWHKVLQGNPARPSSLNPEVTQELDEIVMRGLATDPTQRYQTAEDMAIALEQRIGVATPRVVGGWVQSLAGERLREHAEVVAELESLSTDIPIVLQNELASTVALVNTRASNPAFGSEISSAVSSQGESARFQSDSARMPPVPKEAQSSGSNEDSRVSSQNEAVHPDSPGPPKEEWPNPRLIKLMVATASMTMAVVLGIALFIILSRTQPEGSSDPITIASVSTDQPSDDAIDSGHFNESPAMAAPKVSVENLELPKVKLKIHVRPSNAKVMVGGAERKESEIDIAPSATPIKVVVSAPGYVTMEQQFVPEADGRLTFELKRIASPGPKSTATTQIRGPVETEL